ncbi:MAG: hypothetical protein IT446_14880 [Phycisphaerales bacterium]|nr:hypothetical protein [Phycisphaerales bacterium]
MLGLLSQFTETMTSGESFWVLYDRLRPALFSGFLTASAFLFAMKTFIVATMKRDVYDTDHYIKMISELRTIKNDLPYYGPLCNLRQRLFCAILCCLITSLLQVTVGLVHHWLAAASCLFAALVSVGFVLWSVITVNKNIAEWLDAAEKKRNEEEGKSRGVSPE